MSQSLPSAGLGTHVRALRGARCEHGQPRVHTCRGWRMAWASSQGRGPNSNASKEPPAPAWRARRRSGVAPPVAALSTACRGQPASRKRSISSNIASHARRPCCRRPCPPARARPAHGRCADARRARPGCGAGCPRCWGSSPRPGAQPTGSAPGRRWHPGELAVAHAGKARRGSWKKPCSMESTPAATATARPSRRCNARTPCGRRRARPAPPRLAASALN